MFGQFRDLAGETNFWKSLQNPNLAAVSVAWKIIREFEVLRILWAKKDPGFDRVGWRLDYTVIGTDVNIAQRLASKA